MTYREAVVQLANDAPDVPWAVMTRANLTLCGPNVEPGDVDGITSTEGAYGFEDTFSTDVVHRSRQPEDTAGGHVRLHFGALSLDGIEVELMCGVEHSIASAWRRVAHVTDDPESLAIADREAPVTPLEHERRGYRSLGHSGWGRLLGRVGVEV